MINDAHCHFFSNTFFAVLAKQRSAAGPPPDFAPRASSGKEAGHDVHTPSELCAELGWDDPGDPAALADRWVQELDAHGVGRAVLIASVPGDEGSVAAAVARHPTRTVGFFMTDPAAPDAIERIRRAIVDGGLRGVCLFPAMHHVPLDDERTLRVVDAVKDLPRRPAVFVHCGHLSIGVRRKLGLPSRFDLRLGDPLAVSRLALAFPMVPFIVPHFGAGMLRETLMAADACPNLHLDPSSSNSWIRYSPGLTLEGVFGAALPVTGASRLLFGTDSSFFPRGWQKAVYDRQKAIVEALGVGEQDAGLIFGGNFERLFPG